MKVIIEYDLVPTSNGNEYGWWLCVQHKGKELYNLVSTKPTFKTIQKYKKELVKMARFNHELT